MGVQTITAPGLGASGLGRIARATEAAGVARARAKRGRDRREGKRLRRSRALVVSLKENGSEVSARLLSDGALRMLGMLALTGAADASALVGFEEPENGVHPGRIDLIASFLRPNPTIRRHVPTKLETTHDLERHVPRST